MFAQLMHQALVVGGGGGGSGGGGKTQLWDVTSPAPKWAPVTALSTKTGKNFVASPAIALALEVARASSLGKLIKKLNAGALANGAGAPPPQAGPGR